MFEIISIKFKENYVTIDINTGESFVIPYDVYNFHKLEKGKTICQAEYQQLKDEYNRFDCKRKALNYLSIRSRTVEEMKNYFNRKGFSNDIANSVLFELHEKGYLDDLEFSKKYIHQKLKKKDIGKNLIKGGLYKKGVSRKIVDLAISEVEFIDNLDDLYKLAIGKINRIKVKKNIASKLVFYLKQRGFETNGIRIIIERLRSEGFDL